MVALTGVILILFVIGHLLGNLQIFLGPDWVNSYAQHLRDLGALLWLIRIFLLVAVLLHIYFTILLAIENKRARPADYVDKVYVKASLASRHMVVSGLVVFAFIIFHLLHFTGRNFNAKFPLLKNDTLNHYDVYSMMVYGFQNVYVSVFYIIALFLLTLHLTHGASSFFQSLGLNNKKLTPRLAAAGRILAWLIFIGYVSIPIAVLLGYVRPAQSSMIGNLDPKTPAGPLADKWSRHKDNSRLINPNNRRKFEIIIVGSGLAGGSAAATLGELGYRVKCFCYQDSPRRAHSIAAQGGINAAKNYQNDGDSTYRLFYDTIKGGDFRSREANVYRLAEVSANIIDQCVAQGVPFAREYSGYLANRSFGGAQVSRTFYARGQTGQQLLLGCYQALCRQIAAGTVQMFPQTEMLDVVIVDGHAKGIITRNLRTGKIESHSGDAVVLATGGYGNVFYLSTNARGCNVTATYRAHKKGALFANPCFTQIHPTCIPQSGDYQSKLTLMSESLRNDGRVWVPKRKEDCVKPPAQISESDRDYYLERKYPSFGNLSPRDISSRAAKEVCDEGRGVGPGGRGVYLDFADSIRRLGDQAISERYGNLFEIYEKITGENAYQVPMRIYPAVHYTMGGLWVDYNLMSNVPGLFVIGEANFSDHGANRLGASALMQGLADGYFVLPYTLPNYLAGQVGKRPAADRAEFKNAENAVRDRITRLLSINGKSTLDSIHRELGLLLWNNCGMARNAAGLREALGKIPELREKFWNDVRIPGTGEDFNQSLERAGRVADFLEFAELMVTDALERDESCGGHFREEHQTPDGEALRDDDNFASVFAWEYQGNGKVASPKLHLEPLQFETVHLTQRSYK